MILKDIKQRIRQTQTDDYTVQCVIIHPATERNIYLDGELLKSEDLGEHLGTPVILNSDIKVGEIIIGI